MNNLDMAIAIAKLEGVDFHIAMEDKPDAYLWCDDTESEFNPITDQCLTFQLVIDYEVFIDHRNERVFILSVLSEETSVDFEEGGLPRAVIECILKSKGLYKSEG